MNVINVTLSRLENDRVLERINQATDAFPSMMSGSIEYVCHVSDPESMSFDDQQAGEHMFAWAVYIVHDPCHDWRDSQGCEVQADQNTVLALHRTNGQFRIIGRELCRVFALQIALGEY
jgi:hypothetical protein